VDVETFFDLSPENKQVPLVKIKGHRNNRDYYKSKKRPLVVAALACSRGEDLKPLETLASKNFSLGIEAEKCLSHQSWNSLVEEMEF
jgi:hypothetical protein